ncbi:hypothetical protein [Sinorhizobium fredii]|uniref:hypothetical protein n=1 Tax=Rhizobium fredii TaxID=380 RepID=UPI001872452A|nr:hypothetical protein [Sinorhizobium fredii]
MPFEEPHQYGVGIREVRELVLKLVRPLLAVEQIVAKAPDDHQYGQEPIPRVVVATIEYRSDEIGLIGGA